MTRPHAATSAPNPLARPHGKAARFVVESRQPFTPGPWFYGDEDEGMDGVEYVQVHAGEYGTETFRNIANVEASFGGLDYLPLGAETRANARLIAAAPELLEALDIILFELAEDGAVSMAAIDQADAAIRKARGES